MNLRDEGDLLTQMGKDTEAYRLPHQLMLWERLHNSLSP